MKAALRFISSVLMEKETGEEGTPEGAMFWNKIISVSSDLVKRENVTIEDVLASSLKRCV